MLANSSESHSTAVQGCAKRRSETEENELQGHGCKVMKSLPSGQSSRWEPVLADEYHRPVITELMFIGRIVNKNETSRLLKEITSAWPLPGKPYLKRVRRLPTQDYFEIILKPATSSSITGNVQLPLKDALEDVRIDTTGLADTVTVMPIPSHQPKTKAQFEGSSKLWPIKFREDKYVEKILSDSMFSDEDKKQREGFMRKAIEVAAHGEVKVGAVVVDPKSNEIIAIAHDQRHLHPMQHAVMLAIDLVAKSQGAGAWNLDSSHLYHSSSSKASNPNFEEINNALVKGKISASESKKALPYICTSYDLYVTREPCIMCSMALVHSRIHRVFYGNPVPWGALGSQYKMHVQHGLNHHYEVWKNVLAEECIKLKDLNTCHKNS